MSPIRIYGTGSYVPPKILSNHDLVGKGLDVSDSWIVRRTGIHQRRIADDSTSTSDLAYRASVQALENAGIAPSDPDLIIVATITPDTCCPSAANWLQAKLYAPRAISFDITAACSGYIFGIDVASQYLKSGFADNILVVASEIMSRTLDWKDRTTCILWGDGAGAAILGKGESGPELLSSHIHTDGNRGKNLLLPGGGSRTTPISHQSVDDGLHTLKMIQANRSFKVAVTHFIKSIQRTVKHNSINLEDIDWLVIEALFCGSPAWHEARRTGTSPHGQHVVR